MDDVQEYIEEIRVWIAASQLKLNEDKTEVILIGTKQELDKVNIAHLEIGQASVPIVSSAVRNLGAWFHVIDQQDLSISLPSPTLYQTSKDVLDACLHETALYRYALIIATVFSMVHQPCIFPNCNVSRIPQRDSSLKHPDTVISPQCCLRCIGYQ